MYRLSLYNATVAAFPLSGVGLTKKPYLHYIRDAAEISYLRALKQVFGQNGIMNPGKIFD